MTLDLEFDKHINNRFSYKGMRFPKRYGQSKMETCPFCSKQAISKNKDGLSVCIDHKGRKIPELRCACGSWLEPCKGKFGPYFRCINCGNVNMKKAMEMNSHISPGDPDKKVFTPKEIQVRSDEVDFLFE